MNGPQIIEMFKTFLKVFKPAEKDINASSTQRDTALMCAAAGGHTGVVQKLLDRGANVNARDDIDNTPLIWASHIGYKDAAVALIASGAYVNAENKYGETALTIAMD